MGAKVAIRDLEPIAMPSVIDGNTQKARPIRIPGGLDTSTGHGIQQTATAEALTIGSAPGGGIPVAQNQERSALG